MANSPVHLVAVSRDLAWYEHLHPRRDGERYTATVTFPADGKYIVHSVIDPVNYAQLVDKQDVVVGTAESRDQPLTISPPERRSGHYTIRLHTNPERPAAGVWTSLIFEISRDGRPVIDLTPTGTLGHMVILREDGEDFVYAHSTDGEALHGVRARTHQPALPTSLDNHSRHTGDTGPEVTFHAQFPRVGKYKMWVEFLAGADSIRADFVVDVEAQKQPLDPDH